MMPMLEPAQLVGELRAALTIDPDGKITRTAANVRALRRLDKIFLRNLNRSGYEALLQELVASWPGQLPYFQDILDALSDAMRTPIPPLKFSPRDMRALEDQALTGVESLRDVASSAAARAKSRIMMSFGGLRFDELVDVLVSGLGRTVAESVGLAETGTATYYRSITDRGYRAIERDLPGVAVGYKYEGPIDKLTRPFCLRLLQSKRSYTREQIDRMSNGQIPNVFISAGGWRCRHQWVISLDDPIGVTSVGNVSGGIAEKFGSEAGEIVLTDERRRHIFKSHPELEPHESFVLSTVRQPDEVHRNQSDQRMAIFYKQHESGKTMRVSVLMRPDGSDLSHSIISARWAASETVERQRDRAVWTRN